MPNVVVPLGFDMGSIFAEDGPYDRSPSWYEVHLGGHPQQLNAEQYTAWLGAFHDVAAHADLAVDRAALERHLRTAAQGPAGQLPNPGPIVDGLLERELLLEYDTDHAGEDVFSTLRLLPRAHGLGSTVDRPDRYRIGYPGRPLAQVQALVYQLWSLSLTYPALWYAFEEIAGADVWQLASGDRKPGPEQVGSEVGAALPLLVSSGAAFLDLVNYEPPELTARTLDGQAAKDGEEPVIVPVGLNLGQDFALRADGAVAPWLVHHGMDWAELGPEETVVYQAAFSRPGPFDSPGGLNRQSLAEAVRAAGGPTKAEAVIADLVDRALLVEFDPRSGSLERLFSSIQLFPLARGFGNTTDHPERYWIGVDAPEIWVSGEAYSIWSYSLTGPSLWAACADFATGVDKDLAPGDEPLNYTADELAHMIAPALPGLVAHGCAFIDPVNYGQ